MGILVGCMWEIIQISWVEVQQRCPPSHSGSLVDGHAVHGLWNGEKSCMFWVQGVCGLVLLLKAVLLKTHNMLRWSLGEHADASWQFSLLSLLIPSLSLYLLEWFSHRTLSNPSCLASWSLSRPEPHSESSHFPDYTIVKASWQGPGVLPSSRQGPSTHWLIGRDLAASGQFLFLFLSFQGRLVEEEPLLVVFLNT